MSWNLPKLPGYTFPDPTRTRFHVPRKFDVINGFHVVRQDYRGVGGIPVDVAESAHAKVPDTINYHPSLTYGCVRKPVAPVTLPHWVHYDKRFLTFKGVLKETVGEPPFDQLRVRPICLIYYLEDDTMTVVEPHIKNSGLWQGKMVKRGKIIKNNAGETWHWKDLNIGMDIPLFGYIYHLTSCDDFTKEFMESQGIELPAEEEVPEDPYILSKTEPKYAAPIKKSVTPYAKLKRFLEFDGKILKFDAVWDDRDTEYGELREYQLFYSLYDDTISIKETLTKNAGRDPFPMLLKKMKMPKNHKVLALDSPCVIQEDISSNDSDDMYYKPEDLKIGNKINILGRQFLLCDCDTFTRNYYRDILNIQQGEPIAIEKQDTKPYSRQKSQHNGIGDSEDTCVSFHNKPPHKDLIQFNLNVNKYLRYMCEMISVYPEDEGRHFRLSYHVADGAMQLDEICAKNSGLLGGRFSGPARVYVPGTRTYYTPEMFYIGAVITVNRHRFKIFKAELYVYHYIRENPEKFPPSVIENIRNYHLLHGNIKEPQTGNDAKQDYTIKPRVDNTNFESCLQDFQETAGKSDPADDLENLTIDSGRQPFIKKMPASELPLPLQGLDPGTSSTEADQPIVCLTGPAIPFQDVSGDMDAIDMISRMQSPTIAAGRTTKMVTFAEPLAHK